MSPSSETPFRPSPLLSTFISGLIILLFTSLTSPRTDGSADLDDAPPPLSLWPQLGLKLNCAPTYLGHRSLSVCPPPPPHRTGPPSSALGKVNPKVSGVGEGGGDELYSFCLDRASASGPAAAGCLRSVGGSLAQDMIMRFERKNSRRRRRRRRSGEGER